MRQDAADPTAVIVYGSDLIYCFRRASRRAAGAGATWPGRGLSELLARHGSGPDVGVTGGYVVVRAVAA